jgi:BlaI family penicillinase repressor
VRAGEEKGSSPDAGLSRRERQIIKVLYRKGEATVRDVERAMPDDPGYDTIRVTLSILEKKGRVTHRQEGRRYVYRPVMDVEQASRGAVRDVFRTFFARRPSEAVLAMLDEASTQLSDAELEQIEEWIRSVREGES